MFGFKVIHGIDDLFFFFTWMEQFVAGYGWQNIGAQIFVCFLRSWNSNYTYTWVIPADFHAWNHCDTGLYTQSFSKGRLNNICTSIYVTSLLILIIPQVYEV